MRIGVRSRRGVALLVALVVVVMVMGIGLAFMGETIFRSKQELGERHLDDGLRMCDTAVEQARRFLYLYKKNGTWRWNNILRYNQSFVANNPGAVKALWEQKKKNGELTVNGMAQVMASTWPEAPVPANPTTPANPSTIFGVFSYYGTGAWYMMVRDNDDEPAEGVIQGPYTDTDENLVVYVTAILLDGTTRTTEARVRFEPPLFKPQGAIVANGTANIYGNLTVTTAPGVPAADVISNGSIVFTGSSVVIQGKASAYGTITGAPVGVRDGVMPGAPKATMPIGDPSYYKPMATYIMRSDGTVTDQMGTVLAVGNFYNFSFSSGEWRVNSGTPTPPAAMYYIEGDLSMQGNGVFTATLLVEGSVDMKGTSTGWTLSAATGNVVIVAGKDFKMNGNSTLAGVVVAGEQASVSGNASIQNGSVVALDQGDTSNLVSTSSSFDDSFGGSSTITYPGPQSTFLEVPADTLTLVYTRRVK